MRRHIIFTIMKSKELYSLRQQLVSSITRAIGHPARIAILEYVSEKGECYFGDVEAEVPLAKATISRHLSDLRNAGLVKTETAGPRTKIWIHKKNWEFARKVFNDFFSENFDNIKAE